MLKVIDLGVGNIGSVIKAIKHVGAQFEIISNPEDLEDASGIILPGVGSFSVAAEKLQQSGFKEALDYYVIEKELPLLGICVGMQLLATSGLEGGSFSGLDYIKAEVKLIDNHNGSLIIPHMGWNEIDFGDLELFNGVEPKGCFYFVHSYAMQITDESPELNIAYTDYEQEIVAYVSKSNIHGAQFHPEKSQEFGLTFLKNFISIC